MEAAMDRVEEIFCSALEIEHAAEREAFLEQACAGDVQLRAAVRAKLAAQDAAESFFNKNNPALRLAAVPEVVPSLSAAASSMSFVEEEIGKRIGPYKV